MAAARVPLTNVHGDGAYTVTVLVGPKKQPMNVIVDTGSSALALDSTKYAPHAGDSTTNLAQVVGYADGGGWTGAVVNTDVSIGAGPARLTQKGANTAIAYEMSPNVFRGADGILGLAYESINVAYDMNADTWAGKYSAAQVVNGRSTQIAPCLTSIAAGGAARRVVALYTQRSLVHQGGGAANDPLNQGLMFVGGLRDTTGLAKGHFTGVFQAAKVVAGEWYNTNLKAVIVGAQAAIAVPAGPFLQSPSNSIVDSGNPGLSFGPGMLGAVLAKFTAAQQGQLQASITGPGVAVTDLDLGTWPTLTFIVEGIAGDVRLKIAPGDYWQVNAPRAGLANLAISGNGKDGFVSLGLPLLNGYFTVFDVAGHAIRFATSVR